MTEEQYTCVRNMVKVSMAYRILHDVVPGDDYGIAEDAHKEIMQRLHDAEVKLHMSYHTEG